MGSLTQATMGGDLGDEGDDARGRVSARIEVGVVDADAASTAPAGPQGDRSAASVTMPGLV
jgi:hypothetical protein